MQSTLCLPTNPLAKEIDNRTAPIMWFGELFLPKNQTWNIADFDRNDVRKDKPIVLTIGANPSWCECHDGKNNRRLLTGGKQRVPLLSSPICDILKGFDDYFKNNPFVRWFGPVEEFLNGMGASYFGIMSKRAVHVDLFPFPTYQNYTSIKRTVDLQLMHSGYAPRLLYNLINAIGPCKVVVFGATNYDTLRRYYDNSLPADMPNVFTNAKGTRSYRWIDNMRLYGSYDLVALSCNLGNPVGLSKADLAMWGGIV